MKKHLIFDVDGTLWDSTPIVAESWNRAVSETEGCDVVITSEVLKREFGKPMDVIADHLFGEVTDMDRRQELLEKCYRYEKQFLEENKADISYPGMRESMERLAKDYTLYIVSNCQCGYIELVMEKNHITHLIRDFECFGNTGTCKGETMKILMRRNHISVEDAVYIGDTKGDHEAAVMAGVAFIYAAYGFGEVEEEADAAIREFAELEQAVKTL